MNFKPPLILNASQAEAAYAAMCALNNVSFITLSTRFPANESHFDLEVRVGRLGGVGVYETNGQNFEVYTNQAAFAAAYGLA